MAKYSLFDLGERMAVPLAAVQIGTLVAGIVAYAPSRSHIPSAPKPSALERTTMSELYCPERDIYSYILPLILECRYDANQSVKY